MKQHTERDPFWSLVRVAVRASNREATYQVARCEWRRKNGAFPCAFAAAGPKNYNAVLAAVASIQLVLSLSLSIVA